MHPLLVEGLEDDGFDVNYQPKITPAQVLASIKDYEGLVVNSKVYVGKEMLDNATQLKFVCRAGSGLEVIDLDCAKQKNVIAFNAPEGNRVAVGEHALGMLLNLMNNLSKADAEVRNYKWLREDNRGNELTGKTVGLIAYGNNAQAFAKLLRGFDVKILAYDKYYVGFTDKYVTQAPLQQIFDEADVLSLHLPLTAETSYMIDYKFLSSFKKPVWLVNTSRGKVLNTTDLIQCVTEEKIIAAALDVLENEKIGDLNEAEKLVFEQLIANKKFFLTPHIAGWTHESKRRIAEVLLYKIRNIYN
ncbi:MAG: phosphoglycerate dehydrogenase [Bacteroidota bacterium]|nr:phosphoglycerate dehydrogenase [Bacteroidota bacterium]